MAAVALLKLFDIDIDIDIGTDLDTMLTDLRYSTRQTGGPDR